MLRLLFGSEARVRVLSLMLTHPDSEFYLREIGRMIGVPPHAVRQEMARLVELGLVREDRRGNRVYYRANPACPIFPELKALFLKTVALGDALREALEELGGIDIALIYGSVAANTESLESDIDLLLVGDVASSAITPTLTRIEAELRREINVTILSASELKERLARQEPFISNVLAGPTIYLVGTQEKLRRLAA
jgi:DNA-binding transcriptional ArsR family regulator